MAPAVALGLRRIKQFGVSPGRAETGAQFSVGLLLIQELQEDQVGNLLDVGDRVGYPTSPEYVSNMVELAAKLMIHFVVLLRQAARTDWFISSITARRPFSPKSSIPMLAAFRMESGGANRSS